MIFIQKILPIGRQNQATLVKFETQFLLIPKIEPRTSTLSFEKKISETSTVRLFTIFSFTVDLKVEICKTYT